MAFESDRCVAAGGLHEVARAAKEMLDRRRDASILVLDGGRVARSRSIFAAHRGCAGAAAKTRDVAPAASPANWIFRRAAAGPTELGVVAAEITCCAALGLAGAAASGASVAIRRLVESARRAGEDRDRVRQAQEAAYRFNVRHGGQQAALRRCDRALFADDPARFEKLIAEWPADVPITRRGSQRGHFIANRGANRLNPLG